MSITLPNVTPSTKPVNKGKSKGKPTPTNKPVKGSKVATVKPTNKPTPTDTGYLMLTPSMFKVNKSGRLEGGLSEKQQAIIGEAITGSGLIHKVACMALGLKYETAYNVKDNVKAFMSLSGSRVRDVLTGLDAKRKANWKAREVAGLGVKPETRDGWKAELNGALAHADAIGAHMGTVLSVVGMTGDNFTHRVEGGQEGDTWNRVRILKRWAGLRDTETRTEKGTFTPTPIA